MDRSRYEKTDDRTPIVVRLAGQDSTWLADGVAEPHVKVFDKSERTDGTFSRSDFAFDPERNVYVCPAGKN
jgi:hypothetical protein